jgi:NAD(P)-dependent dehydrogenase (short-subunit alcohol dehydrogenase family)
MERMTPPAMFAPDALAGRVAAVTGAAGGIGSATVALLSQLGCSVALLDIDTDGAERAAMACNDALVVDCDMSDAAQVDAAVKAVLQRWGGCDILVNNAAVVSFGRLEDTSLDEWERAVSVNLRGYFLCTQRFGRHMLEQRSGTIVNVLSAASTWPETMAGGYSAAKAGQALLTTQTAVEWGPYGVRCNGVSPALIRTPLSEPFWRDPVIGEQRKQLVPLRRAGEPSEVASVIAFFAGDAASYVNGQIIEVDGGWSRSLIEQLPRPGLPRTGPA